MTNEKMYLSELIKRDKIKYGSNNLIKAPVGSGKTYLINELGNEHKGKKIMLVSSTALKDKISMSEDTYTTQNLRKDKLNITDEDIYVMTYAEFGERVKWSRSFMYDFSVIFCDEIHSLFDYYFIGRNQGLGAAIGALFDKDSNIKKFYFTATTHEIDAFIDKEYEDLYKNVTIVDYYDSEEIVRYVAYSHRKFTGTHEIEDAVLELKGMKLAGKKGVIYNERIDGMELTQKMLKRQGYNAISIWSVNNEERPMTDEQLAVREVLLRDEVIPKGYDFLIINGAMREGWNLKDPDVEVVILNTLNETNKEQALGRVRKNISLLYTRIKDGVEAIDDMIMSREKTLGVIELNLGNELNRADQDEIIEKLNVRRAQDGRLVKWPTISKALRKNGYTVKSKRVRENGKQITVQIVTRTERKAKPSTESRSSNFLARLGKTKFAEVNKGFLSNYINKDDSIAYSHIKAAYERFVGAEDWTERKFTDVTYLLASDKKIFSKDNFVQCGVDYHSNDKIEIAEERAKYEDTAQRELEELKKQEKEKKDREDEELLRYIAEHGGK